MPKASKNPWTPDKSGTFDTQPVEVLIDGENAGSFQKIRLHKNADGKVEKVAPADLVKALNLKDAAQARVIVAGVNKLRASQARAAAKAKASEI